MTKFLTTEQAARMARSACPFCGDDAPHYGHVEIEGEFAVQRATCPACEADWAEEYQLSHVHHYVTGDDLHLPKAAPDHSDVIELRSVKVQIWPSTIDGKLVVQIDTTPDLDRADGSPDVRVYLNDGLTYGDEPVSS